MSDFAVTLGPRQLFLDDSGVERTNNPVSYTHLTLPTSDLV